MKKLVALLLVFVMVFALCACGAKEEAPAEGIQSISIERMG